MHPPTFIIDFDSTIIRHEALEELAQIALQDKPDRGSIMRQLREINELGMSGELSFDQSLRQRLRLFATGRAQVAKLTMQLCEDITPSVAKNQEWFNRKAKHIYILSGGFDDYVVPVVACLGIAADHVLANAFVFDSTGQVSGYDDTRLLNKAKGKVRQLSALQLTHPIIVIGDGYTDYEMRAHGEADVFWAFCENVNRPSVTAHADRIFNSFDEIVKATEGM